MRDQTDRIDQAIVSISRPENTDELSEEIAKDALSTVVDAINASVNGLIITDLGSVIQFANPAFCKMFAYPMTDVIGKNAVDLFSDNDIRDFIDVLSIIDESGSRTEEFTVQTKNGVAFFVEVSASHVTSTQGEGIGRMASFVDITKSKMLEADLEQRLHEALNQLNILSGVLPICASCKRIRDDRGGWNQIEEYICERSEAEFSHGICPECVNKLYPNAAGKRIN